MTGSRRDVSLGLVAALLIATFGLYHSALESMASVWFKSDAFIYGVLILPMSVYMIWQKRAVWTRVPARPALIGIVLLLLCLLAWVAASLVSVQLGSQLAFIGMLGAVIWSILGTKVVRVLSFPLLYAFFAVPFGEFLIPPLMDWTAYFAVQTLQLTGVPVLRVGHVFSLPSGDFEVVEACSGIRFLLVTVVLGAYFAHETFNSWTKRLIFVAGSALVIIVANGARAYIVVLIAHYSNMEYGTGQSHIVIGWIIFFVAITTLFWIGWRYEDTPEKDPKGVDSAAPAALKNEKGPVHDLVFASVVVLAMLIAAPPVLDLGRERLSRPLPHPLLPIATDDWSGPQKVSLGYAPTVPGASDIVAAQYTLGSQPVELHVAFYAQEEQGNELVGWRSKVVDRNKWQIVSRERISIPAGSEELPVESVLISDSRQVLRLWYWYDVGGALTPNPRMAKILQAWNAVTGKARGDALIALVTTDGDEESGSNAEYLERFVRERLGNTRACLRPGAGGEAMCVSQIESHKLELQ